MKRARGFSLIEMLVVIIILLVLMTAAVALFNEMFRGQEVREAGRIVAQALADAREFAAKENNAFFVTFVNDTNKQRGVLKLFKDTTRLGGGAKDGLYTFDTSSGIYDLKIDGGTYFLPRFCYFSDPAVEAGRQIIYPAYIALYPTGYARAMDIVSGVHSQRADVQRSVFDANALKGDINDPNDPMVFNKDKVDIGILVPNRRYKALLDFDPPSGKVRRQVFMVK